MTPMPHPMIAGSAQIHPQAEVKNSSIGARTRVWQFASVIRHAHVGDDCSIASCAIVDGADVGDGSIVSHGAFIDPGIVVESGVFIGPQVSLCNDFWPRAHRRGWFDIEDLISGKVVVTRVENSASIGANAVIMPGLVIGVRAMVAAGAVVTKDVPMDHLYRRDGVILPIDPARDVRRMRQVDLPVKV